MGARQSANAHPRLGDARPVSDRGALNAEPLRWFLVANKLGGSSREGSAQLLHRDNPGSQEVLEQVFHGGPRHEVSGIVGAPSLP